MFGFGRGSGVRKDAEAAGLSYVASTPGVARSGVSNVVPKYAGVAYGRVGRELVFTGNVSVQGFDWRESGLFLGLNVPSLAVSGYFSPIKGVDDGLRPVVLESAAFNDMYRVKCNDHRFATAFLNQRLMDSMVQVESAYFAIVDGWLTVRRVDGGDPWLVSEAQWGFLRSIVLFMEPWLREEFGVDFGVDVPDGVALQRLMPAL